MGSCNLGEHIAEDHMRMDITTCNIEDSQPKCRLETVRNILLGGGGANMFYWDQTSPFASARVQKHLVRMKVSLLITGNNFTDKTYDESEMRTRQKQHIKAPEDP